MITNANFEGYRCTCDTVLGTINYYIMPIPFCCGGVLVMGVEWPVGIKNCESANNISQMYKEFSDHLAFIPEDSADIFSADLYGVRIDGLLRRKMMMIIDAVGGENGERYASIYDMCKENGDVWSSSTDTVFNPKSGNKLQLFIMDKNDL